MERKADRNTFYILLILSMLCFFYPYTQLGVKAFMAPDFYALVAKDCKKVLDGQSSNSMVGYDNTYKEVCTGIEVRSSHLYLVGFLLAALAFLTHRQVISPAKFGNWLVQAIKDHDEPPNKE
ncbi:hypothetical protein [Gallaecimonas pentaromativorans]|uniref:hypothetical protein n=1 Tax=Gallaecimonas pentaromativorans TaxID=584787 RepID=UPI003A917751